MSNDINVKETSDAELGRLKREASPPPPDPNAIDPRGPEGRRLQVLEAFGKWWEEEAGQYECLTRRDLALLAWLSGAIAALKGGGAE